ncbi:MAG: hypothetical protein AB7I19_01195 [Planctomycetota bacterium]
MNESAEIRPPIFAGRVGDGGRIEIVDAELEGSFRLVHSRYVVLTKRSQGKTLRMERELPAIPVGHAVLVSLVEWSLRFTVDDEHLRIATYRVSFERGSALPLPMKFVVTAQLADNNADNPYEARVAYRIDTLAPLAAPAVLSLAHAAGGIALAGANRSVETPLTWDTQLVSHPELMHGGGEIELRQGGRYQIDLSTSVGAQTSVDGEAAPAIALQRRVGVGFVDLPGAIAVGALVTPSAIGPAAALSVRTILDFAAGTRLRGILFNASASGLAAATVPGTSRMSILRLHPQ